MHQNTGATNGYSVFTLDFANEATYNLKLRVTLVDYPDIFTEFSDESLTWTITVVNPCKTTTLNSLPNNFDTMYITLLGPA